MSGKCSSRGIVQLRTGQVSVGVAGASRNQHDAVVEQRGRVIGPRGIQTAREGEGLSRGIVELRSGQVTAGVLASCNQNHAVVQQRRGVEPTRGVQAPSAEGEGRG